MAIWDKTVVKVAGIVGALGVIGTTGWATIDYLEIRPVMKREFLQMAQKQADIVEQLQQSQSAIVENLSTLEVKSLLAKRETVGLNFDEQQKLCRLSRELKYAGIPGCN